MSFSHFSAQTFYGSGKKSKLMIEEGCYVPADFHSRLAGPSVVWKVFSRLQLAIQYAAKHTNDAMVFSFEKKSIGGCGQRMFLVTHPKHMWLIHRDRSPLERHSYEVIQEGKPCKLYFDIEFCKVLNPEKNGVLMTKIFIKCVIVALQEAYGITCTESDVLWLDSSTEKKYSCHLIFITQQIAFKDNSHAGGFVWYIIQKIKTQVEGNDNSNGAWPSVDQLKQLYVELKSKAKDVFCDMCVYSKNQNFRLYLSCKYKKNIPLVCSIHNKFVPFADDSSNIDTDSLIFYDSLTTYFTQKRLLLLESNFVKTKIICNVRTPNHSHSNSIEGCSSSLYPEIDKLILDIISCDANSGYIRKWTYFNEKRILIYDIGRYRYCSNIGRYHKSNNIMFWVELENKVVYQKCYDPECRAQNFKAAICKLPESICELLKAEEQIFELDSFNDFADDDNYSELFFSHDSEMYFHQDYVDISREEEFELVKAAEAFDNC